MPKTNIIFIGFMGVGKGTTARAYAKKYAMYNIDTDDLIESKTNKTIKKIFKKRGEKHFRKLEQDTANWIEESINHTLVSCGGGFYNVDNIAKLGTIVLLDASFDWIHNRLKTAKNSTNKLAKRPLFSDIENAKKLYNKREQDYKSIADIVVCVENKSMEEICQEIHDKSPNQ